MDEIKTPEGGTIIQIPIENEVRQAYIDYSMSVIIQRALPDVRDGLKPVHRRILYAMDKLNLASSGPTRKCAQIVGEVLGHYHPHGDASVYDALVRLGQDFSQRYTTVTPKGNFGTIGGFPAAAYRYTEAKMAKIAEEMVKDIDKDTIDMIDNFDQSTKEPTVLPAQFPYLLCNGTTGIAVGMATNMPSHNLREVASAIGAYIDNRNISIDELMAHIKGPDFPTGGVIYGREGFRKAYRTGRGKIVIRSKFEIETAKNGRESIVFTEVPYGVNTTNVIKKIKDLARDKAIDGISSANDESSDRTGLRLVVELKRGAIAKLVVNQLFAKTELQSNFSVINLALVPDKNSPNGQNLRPQILNLKQLIEYFVDHRVDVITRRTKFELNKALARKHILDALIIAVDAIDEVIKIIRASRDVQQAKASLEARFGFDDVQSTAIVDMQLRRLTNLQIEELKKELAELETLIAYYQDLLAHEEKIFALVKTETNELADKFGDDRKTDIVAQEAEELHFEDMVKEEDVVVTVSKFGYIKRLPLTLYKAQGRGGKGVGSGSSLVEDDYISQIFTATTHSYLIFITTKGRAFGVKVHEIPEASRSSRGTNIKSLLQVVENEEISTILVMKDISDTQCVFMATKNGIVKKCLAKEFANARTRGIVAIILNDGDTLVSAILSEGNGQVMLVTKKGQALLIDESTVRTMGRSSIGVHGIRLSDGDSLAAAIAVQPDTNALIVTERGHGKRVDFQEFNSHGRGTGGQRIFGNVDGKGPVIGAISVAENDEIVCITSRGKTIRVKVADISLQGRTASGNRIINIDDQDYVVGFDRIAQDQDDEK